MASTIKDLNKLCIHTITTKPLPFEVACESYAKLGVKGISIWRDAVAGLNFRQVKDCLRKNDLTPVSYVRGGFFPSADENKRQEAIHDNLQMIEEASEMEIPMIVLVCGAEPAQSLEVSREQIKLGIEAILPFAEKCKVKLAIEPLHPMFADSRSAITSLKQANELAEYFNSDKVGVAVDVYHLWFDDELETQIKRCGKNNNLFAFHICDWNVPTVDMLNDRGLMGEGCIDVKKIRGWVEETGFDGFNEVEIFSNKFWKEDQQEFLNKIAHAYLHHS